MLKRELYYFVAMFSVAVLMTAGCAKQEVVKKDEGIAPATVAKQAEKSEPSLTPTKQDAASPVTQVMPSSESAQQTRKASSIEQLQSALQKIYFDFDSASLSESARQILTKNADALLKESTPKIRIEGNCDERGSAEYNLALGERRAKSAQQYLITLGVKPDRLSTISYGKEKPAVKGNDDATLAKNRRDEFVVVTQ